MNEMERDSEEEKDEESGEDVGHSLFPQGFEVMVEQLFGANKQDELQLDLTIEELVEGLKNGRFRNISLARIQNGAGNV